MTTTNSAPFPWRPARSWSILCVLSLLGCMEPPEDELRSGTPPPGLFRARLTDAPVEGLSEVWVNIASFELRRCEGDSPWIDVPVGSEPYQLLSLQNGVTAPLVLDTTIPAGQYCEIRLVVDDDGNHVVVNGESAPLKVPSGSVKLKTDFEIAGGVATELVVDFDAQQSIEMIANGNGYQIHPVIHVVDVSYEAVGEVVALLGEYVGSVSFEVDPLLGGVFDIGGGSTITFPPDAVDGPTWFTASRWRHLSNSAPGDAYRFYPPYEFSTPPKIELAHTADDTQTHAVAVDGTLLPSFEPDDTRVAADAPHFCVYEPGKEFPDVPPGQWYTWFVNRIACEGIISGHADGTYKPSDPITRAELIKVISLLITQQENIDAANGGVPFADVGPNDWFYQYLVWAHENDLISDTQGQPNFRPNEPVTRAEAARWFVVASDLYAVTNGIGGGAHPIFATLANYKPGGALAPADEVFSDVKHGGQPVWYYEYVYAMQRAHVMVGQGGTENFGPSDTLNRAQAAKVACLASGHCVGSVPDEDSLPAYQIETNCGGYSGVYCVHVNLRAGAKLKPFMATGPTEVVDLGCRGYSDLLQKQRWGARYNTHDVAGYTEQNYVYDGYALQDASVLISGGFTDGMGALAFAVKVKKDGLPSILSHGYECNANAGSDDMRILEIFNDQGYAEIEDLDFNKFDDLQNPKVAPESIAGVSAEFSAAGSKNQKRGRNFVGLKNPYPYQDGYGTVVFVLSRHPMLGEPYGITNAQAVALLTDRGCPKYEIIQYDGSSVAQFSEKDGDSWKHTLTYGFRVMPQVFAVFAP